MLRDKIQTSLQAHFQLSGLHVTLVIPWQGRGKLETMSPKDSRAAHKLK